MERDDDGRRYVVCGCGTKIFEHYDGHGDCVPSEGDRCGPCRRAEMRRDAEEREEHRRFLRSVARPGCNSCGGTGFVECRYQDCVSCLVAEVRRLQQAVSLELRRHRS